MPEGKHLALTESYRKELHGLFKALLAMSRETHIKQLEIPACGAAGGGPGVKVLVSPQLSLEPLVTYYLRRARSYRFVRDVCSHAFGPEGMGQMRRLTAAGHVDISRDSELGIMEALFHGAYLRSCEEIGLEPEADPNLENPAGPRADHALPGAWLSSIGKDPDLGQDIRMMVPVFYDVARKQTKV